MHDIQLLCYTDDSFIFQALAVMNVLLLMYEPARLQVGFLTYATLYVPWVASHYISLSISSFAQCLC